MPATGHYLWLVLAPASVYVQAIVSIVSILEKYDEDKNFEAYGFGGMLPNGQVWRNICCGQSAVLSKLACATRNRGKPARLLLCYVARW